MMLGPQWAAHVTTPTAPCPITHTRVMAWDPCLTMAHMDLTDMAMAWDPCLITVLMMTQWDPCQTTAQMEAQMEAQMVAQMVAQMAAHMGVQMGVQMVAHMEALVEVSYCRKHISLHVTKCCQQYKIGKR